MREQREVDRAQLNATEVYSIFCAGCARLRRGKEGNKNPRRPSYRNLGVGRSRRGIVDSVGAEGAHGANISAEWNSPRAGSPIQLIFVERSGDFQISPSVTDQYHGVTRFPAKSALFVSDESDGRNSAIEIPARDGTILLRGRPAGQADVGDYGLVSLILVGRFPTSPRQFRVRAASQLHAINHSRVVLSLSEDPAVPCSSRFYFTSTPAGTSRRRRRVDRPHYPATRLLNVTLTARLAFTFSARESALSGAEVCNENFSFVAPPSIRFYAR